MEDKPRVKTVSCKRQEILVQEPEPENEINNMLDIITTNRYTNTELTGPDMNANGIGKDNQEGLPVIRSKS